MVGGVELLEVADLRCPKEGPKPTGSGFGLFPSRMPRDLCPQARFTLATG